METLFSAEEDAEIIPEDSFLFLEVLAVVVSVAEVPVVAVADLEASAAAEVLAVAVLQEDGNYLLHEIFDYINSSKYSNLFKDLLTFNLSPIAVKNQTLFVITTIQ